MSRGALAAVVELRARLFLARLRGRGGAGEGIALGLLFVLAIPASLVFAFLVGGGSYRAARSAHGASVEVSLAAIFFGVWQTWTAVSLSLADRDALDLRRFLPFPLSPARVYAVGLATSALSDPFAVFWSVVLAGVFGGAALARPGAWLALLALLLLLYGAATVAFAAVLQELGARLARSRHFRVIALAAAVLGWGVLAALGAAWAEAPREAMGLLRRLQWLAFPPALASAAAIRLYAGDVAGALQPLALLLAAAPACGLVAYRVALGSARAGGEGGAGARRASAPGVLGRLDPLLEKELRFLLRSPVLRLYLIVLPVLAAIAGWQVAGRAGGAAAELAAALPFLGAAIYAHLVTQPFWVNGFGWERGGARLYFLAPVDLAAALRAKNRATALAAGALFLVACGGALAAGAVPPAWAAVGALALHLGVAPALHGLGNVVSAWNPRAAAFGAQRGGHVAPASALAGMAIVSSVSGLFSLPVLAAIRTEQPWAMPAGWVGLGLLALAVYRRSLPRTAALVRARREALLAAVCGDDD